MKFEIGSKVKTPDGKDVDSGLTGTILHRYEISAHCVEYAIKIDEPNFYATRWGSSLVLFYLERELRKVSNEV